MRLGVRAMRGFRRETREHSVGISFRDHPCARGC